jgi:hypothetical protein
MLYAEYIPIWNTCIFQIGFDAHCSRKRLFPILVPVKTGLLSPVFRSKLMAMNQTNVCTIFVGRCSSVSIATGYGLDGPAIESRWRRDFPHLSIPALGPTQPPVQSVPGLSRGKERPGRDADPSPSSSTVGHERVELYLYSLYGPYGLYKGEFYLYLNIYVPSL